MMKIVNGENQIIGRVSAGVAKQLLKGEEVAIVNCEKLVMSGNIVVLVGKYEQRRSMRNKICPENSPSWPRRPDLFVRRIVRGMLPADCSRGRNAFKKLHVYIGMPEGEMKGEAISFPGTSADKLETKYHTIQKICDRLGYQR